MEKRVKVSMWLLVSTKERFRRAAKRQKRSMSNLNELIITGYLKRRIN